MDTMTSNTAYGILASGAPLEKARGAVILLHGRGSDGHSMLGLAASFAQDDLAYLAVEAPRGTWYPQSFLAPLTRNEPFLTQSLSGVGDAIRLAEAQNIAKARIALVGFSQGACLGLEYAARNAGRFGGVAALSGGLIGPEVSSRNYAGSLAGTPVFIGCSDVDTHIPLPRVHESAAILRGLGADVTARIYPGMGHTINEDEIQAVRSMLAAM